MHTECPSCHTSFRISPAQLRAAGGKVRCGECLAVFDARQSLQKDVEEPKETRRDQTFAPVPSKVTAPEPSRPSRPAPSVAVVPKARQPVPAHQKNQAALPFELCTRKTHSGRGWALLSAGLLVLFVGQYVWFNQETLQGTPALRPLAEALCGVVACPPVSTHDPEAFELTGRGVQTHPAYQGALLIDATFVNRSDQPQGYPELELVFTDPEGVPLARRLFTPAEYLGQEPQQPLAAGAEAHVSLELLDPGDLAVGYEFRFF